MDKFYCSGHKVDVSLLLEFQQDELLRPTRSSLTGDFMKLIGAASRAVGFTRAGVFAYKGSLCYFSGASSQYWWGFSQGVIEQMQTAGKPGWLIFAYEDWSGGAIALGQVTTPKRLIVSRVNGSYVLPNGLSLAFTFNGREELLRHLSAGGCSNAAD